MIRFARSSIRDLAFRQGFLQFGDASGGHFGASQFQLLELFAAFQMRKAYIGNLCIDDIQALQILVAGDDQQTTVTR